MRHPISHIHLQVDAPSHWLKRPRLWCLICGFLLVAGSVSLLFVNSIEAWFASAASRSEVVIILLLFVIGLALATHALRSDVFRVHWVQFKHDGFHLNWSHAESLVSSRTIFDSEIGWAQVKTLEWIEGQHEHSEDQFLIIELHETLGRGHPRIRVRVCEQRNLDKCERLLNILPTDVSLPIWIKKARESSKH